MTKKRLSVLIAEDLFDEYRKNIDWGLRQYLFSAILRLIIDAVKQDGMLVVGAILSGDYKLARVEKDRSDAGQDIVMKHTDIRG